MITRFPADELLVAGRQYVRGADFEAPHTAIQSAENGRPRSRRAGEGLSVHLLIRREDVELGPSIAGAHLRRAARAADRRATPARRTPVSRWSS